MVSGKRLTLPNRCSTAATVRSRTSSPLMPPVVARNLMASRSQQSSAKATRTFAPLSQPIEQETAGLHHSVNSFVIGRVVSGGPRGSRDNGQSATPACQHAGAPFAGRCGAGDRGLIFGIEFRRVRRSSSIERLKGPMAKTPGPLANGYAQSGCRWHRWSEAADTRMGFRLSLN